MELCVTHWLAKPFSVANARSTVFEDESAFPRGSIEFDHALVMRDIRHEWRTIPAPTI